MKFSWFFVILLLVLVAIFSVQNAEPMTVRFVTWQFSMSAALVIQLAAVLGALVGLVCGAYSRRGSRADRRSAPVAPVAIEPHAPTESSEPIQRLM